VLGQCVISSVGARFVDLAGQVLAAWLGSMEERLFRELPGILRGLSAEQLGAFPRYTHVHSSRVHMPYSIIFLLGFHFE
jgi:hypothetical protein